MLSLIEPLALIVAAVNVPVSVGDADRTTFPEPVLVATPVTPFVTAKTPDELAPSARMDRLREIVMRYPSFVQNVDATGVEGVGTVGRYDA